MSFSLNRLQSLALLWDNKKIEAYIQSLPPLIPSTLNILPSTSRVPVKKMGNLCFRGESIRKIEIEIEGLRNDIARLDKDRKASEVKAEGGRTTASTCGGGGISYQTTEATMGKAVGHSAGLGGYGESKAIEELVPMRWKQGTRRGTGAGGGRSRRRAA